MPLTKIKASVNVLQKAKNLVTKFHNDLEKCSVSETDDIIAKYTNCKYRFRTIHPFRELTSTKVALKFWNPLKKSFPRMQRRPDIFFAGFNSLAGKEEEVWVLSMGHFLGNFDADWLGIRHTRQMMTIRFAEFSMYDESSDKILQTGLFLDVIGLMQSVGMNPLPPSTGSYFPCYPGPRTHDGLVTQTHCPDPSEGKQTQQLIDTMVADLSSINHLNSCPPEILQKTWHEDMLWYGPAGIGSSYSIPRYQQQHQLPFRAQLSDKKFEGHEVRIAEGKYAAFFGWPMNLSNTPTGGFLGLPGGTANCPMQVVDVYRRDGDKLAENWIFIDLPYYLKHQGLDVIERTTGIMNPSAIEETLDSTSMKKNETELITTKLAVKRKISSVSEDDEVAPAAKKAPVDYPKIIECVSDRSIESDNS
mmetsp:Transcript_8931/g.10338  ORF Transcript_8931/g.10338 Transcript_8931/m.10338 type:complete len:418 (+) Transcript_8931:110-1363(+)